MPNADGIVVTDGRRYVGWLPRTAIERAMAEGHDHEAVSHLPIVDGGLVACDMRLQEAFGFISSRDSIDLDVPLVV